MNFVKMIFLGLLVAFFIGMAVYGQKRSRQEFDERQQALQNQGYRYAAYAMMSLAVLLFLWGEELVSAVGVEFLGILSMFVGVGTYVCYAILHDAYFDMKQRQKKSWLILLAFAFTINLAVVLKALYSATFRWELHGVNLVIATTFGMLFLSCLYKNFQDKREEQE